ncbi:TPA: hypothetical protein ACGO1N_001871, partial [Streptococcus suis]
FSKIAIIVRFLKAVRNLQYVLFFQCIVDLSLNFLTAPNKKVVFVMKLREPFLSKKSFPI